MEYTQLESLIPFKDDREMQNEIEKKRGEAYKLALEEHSELIQQLVVKNKHIKEIIDQMRYIIWEINTMLAMRWFGIIFKYMNAVSAYLSKLVVFGRIKILRIVSNKMKTRSWWCLALTSCMMANKK